MLQKLENAEAEKAKQRASGWLPPPNHPDDPFRLSNDAAYRPKAGATATFALTKLDQDHKVKKKIKFFCVFLLLFLYLLLLLRGEEWPLCVTLSCLGGGAPEDCDGAGPVLHPHRPYRGSAKNNNNLHLSFLFLYFLFFLFFFGVHFIFSPRSSLVLSFFLSFFLSSVLF
jgi:hypothetical protein